VLGLGVIVGGVWYALELTRAPAPEAAPVENLRSGLFTVPKE